MKHIRNNLKTLLLLLYLHPFHSYHIQKSSHSTTTSIFEWNNKPYFLIVTDDSGPNDITYSMASINSNEKSPGDPPDKKLSEVDCEKQPLSGVSLPSNNNSLLIHK